MAVNIFTELHSMSKNCKNNFTKKGNVLYKMTKYFKSIPFKHNLKPKLYIIYIANTQEKN